MKFRWHMGVVAVVAGLICTLAGCGRPEKPPVAHDLVADDVLERTRARESYLDMGRHAVPILAQTARTGEDDALRREALLMLGRVADEHSGAVVPAARALGKFLIDYREAPENVRVRGAVAALRMIGPPAVPPLAELLAETGVDLEKWEQTPKTLDVVATMVNIDREQSIHTLIRLLQQAEEPRRQANIVQHLRQITKEQFGYREGAGQAQNEQVVKQWIAWWESRQEQASHGEDEE